MQADEIYEIRQSLCTCATEALNVADRLKELDIYPERMGELKDISYRLTEILSTIRLEQAE